MKVLAVIVVLFGLLLAGCTSTGTESTNAAKQVEVKVQNISAKEAKERLDKEKDIILLDVRTQEEYDEKHIPNSILISYDIIESVAEEKLPDKNAVIFAYCRSGRRSGIAAESLVKMGYKNVYNIGGIIDWPYETETGK